MRHVNFIVLTNSLLPRISYNKKKTILLKENDHKCVDNEVNKDGHLFPESFLTISLFNLFFTLFSWGGIAADFESGRELPLCMCEATDEIPNIDR